MIEFVFMLTHNDATVANALDVLEELRDSGLRYVGFKDVGAERRAAAPRSPTAAHDAGPGGDARGRLDQRRGRAALAARRRSTIGVDWVLGGTNPEDGAEILAGAEVRYCPFPGTVVGHPSVLEGTIEEIAADAAPAHRDCDGVARRRPARLPARDRRRRARSPAPSSPPPTAR